MFRIKPPQGGVKDSVYEKDFFIDIDVFICGD